MRLLLVEDDQNLGKATADGLRDHFAVDWVLSAEEALEAQATTTYAMIVLDINLPEMSGLDFLKGLRMEKSPMPVLLLTARDAIRHRIEGLNMGADDYLVKPFDLDELVARCSALMRRSVGQVSPMIQYKTISYETATGYLEKDGQPVTLSARESAVFACLISNIGRTVPKAKITESVYDWSNEDVESNTIEVHIASLRRKLGRDLIKTVRGRGYMIEP